MPAPTHPQGPFSYTDHRGLRWSAGDDCPVWTCLNVNKTINGLYLKVNYPFTSPKYWRPKTSKSPSLDFEARYSFFSCLAEVKEINLYFVSVQAQLAETFYEEGDSPTDNKTYLENKSKGQSKTYKGWQGQCCALGLSLAAFTQTQDECGTC